MNPMTMRERMLAVIQGREYDRVPFAIYEILVPPKEVLQHLGRGRIGIIRFCPVYKVIHPNCRFDTQLFFDEGCKYKRTQLYTPKGVLEELRIFEPAYDSSVPKKYFITTKQDYEIFWSYLEDCEILENLDQYFKDLAELGDDGFPKVECERTPWQQLWVEWVGLEALSLHVADFPDHVEHTIDLLMKRERKQFEIAYKSPAPFINIPDNITAPAIGPKRFRKYCVSLYDELGGMLAERGAKLFIHMDGLLKPLWKDIANSRVGGLDSFTPVPDCDTTVAEALSLWPDKVLQLNFPSSVHVQSPLEVRRVADEILETAGHSGRLQIQISENVPLDVWRTTLPIIADAIEDFGNPFA